MWLTHSSSVATAIKQDFTEYTNRKYLRRCSDNASFFIKDLAVSEIRHVSVTAFTFADEIKSINVLKWFFVTPTGPTRAISIVRRSAGTDQFGCQQELYKLLSC